MKNAKLITLLTLLISLPAAADEPSPVGEWEVQNGDAHIRILRCGDALWGFIDWLKTPGGTDENNPDPATRDRPLLGLPILRGMKPEATLWNGEIYNSDNGKTYAGSIELNAPDVLYVKGCLLGRWLCGGEEWKRLIFSMNRKEDQARCKAVLKTPSD
jgi:uncharacterized protein (DUF2147 family)